MPDFENHTTDKALHHETRNYKPSESKEKTHGSSSNLKGRWKRTPKRTQPAQPKEAESTNLGPVEISPKTQKTSTPKDDSMKKEFKGRRNAPSRKREEKAPRSSSETPKKPASTTSSQKTKPQPRRKTKYPRSSNPKKSFVAKIVESVLVALGVRPKKAKKKPHSKGSRPYSHKRKGGKPSRYRGKGTSQARRGSSDRRPSGPRKKPSSES